MANVTAAAPSSSSSSVKGVNVTKRLQQELMTIMMGGDNSGCTAFPDGDNLYKWLGTIAGSAGTAYEGLEYKLSIEFPMDYPYKPPTIRFTTPCYRECLQRFTVI
jgi:ubiquitin-conjugating enzyme E2 C